MKLASLAETVERAREGDSEAWGEIYETLAPLIFRMCRRVLPTREDAEDATGEIFLKAQMHLGQYDTERPFQAWLYRVAANHCWDELRKRRGRKEKEAAELTGETIQSHEMGPHQELLANETKREIRAGLAQLSDRDRMAITLRYFAELSYEEIAEVLGVTSTFVGVLLLRARQKLRRILTSTAKQ